MIFIPPPPTSRQIGRKLGKLLATMRKLQTPVKPQPTTPQHTMSTTTQRPTPETDAVANTAWDGATDDYSAYAKMLSHARKLERERDEAREQIASCAINTNVRLFDLVRYMRSELHQASLITDEEYSWLCNGCEMANSPQGGSPSPRRLEDYDVMSEQLEAMREAIKDAHYALAYVYNHGEGSCAFPYRTEDDLCSENRFHHVKDALDSLKPFLP